MKQWLFFIFVGVFAWFFLMNNNANFEEIGFKNMGIYELYTENILNRLKIGSKQEVVTLESLKRSFETQGIFQNLTLYTQKDVLLVEYELKEPVCNLYFKDKKFIASFKGDPIKLDYYRDVFHLPNVIVNDCYTHGLYQDVFELFRSINSEVPCFKISEIHIDQLTSNKQRREIKIKGLIQLENEIHIEIRTLFSNYEVMFTKLIPCIEQFLKKSPQKNTIDVMKLDMRFKQHVVCYE